MHNSDTCCNYKSSKLTLATPPNKSWIKTWVLLIPFHSYYRFIKKKSLLFKDDPPFPPKPGCFWGIFSRRSPVAVPCTAHLAHDFGCKDLGFLVTVSPTAVVFPFALHGYTENSAKGTSEEASCGSQGWGASWLIWRELGIQWITNGLNFNIPRL